MKRLLLKFTLCAGAVWLAWSPAASIRAEDKSGWTTDEAKALAKAKADKKWVLMDFTGSDWCPWCMRLDKEVFSDPVFKKFAADNLVLVELDFPHTKPLAPDLRRQNEALAEHYGVETFPTLVVLNAEGKFVGMLDGYPEGGAKRFVEALRKAKG